MSVADFFFCRRAYADHFNLEMQRLTRQRMIPINGDLVAVYRRNRDRLLLDPAPSDAVKRIPASIDSTPAKADRGTT